MQGSLHVVRRNDIPDRVKVLAVGEEDTDRKGRPIKSYAYEGGVIYIKKHSGQRFKFEGMDYIIITNKDIIGRA